MEWLSEEWQQAEDHDNDMHAVEAHNHHHQHGSSFRSPVALDRRSTAGSSTSNGPAPSTNSFRSSYESYHELHAPLSPPSHLVHRQSSPSVVSSLNYSSVPGGWSPLHRQTSSTPSPSQVAAAANTRDTCSGRNELARRLTLLAQRLACDDDIDELAFASQLEQMEKAVSPPSSPNPRRRQLPQHEQRQAGSSSNSQTPNPQTPKSPPPRSETESVLGSPLSMIRSQFSDLSLVSMREREREREQERLAEEERASRERTCIAEAQAKQLIAEANKLNEELSQVAENLKARQEEMEHINLLLVERTERAAERIVFLQNRVAYLERELDENDDELQHLRICLKAVEIQLPPNPDEELQRCINVFKEDFRQLKRSRASRAASVASSRTFVTSAPTTPNPGSKRLPSTSYQMYTTPPRNDMS
ncbi:hypothetical protein ISF_01954 [Cordyceps fumosorosea ARSEF 2679]|uniref:Uncharacterized protein n=1 Tax=Cordyceps fumosorosea (strain ARSEF 2679) TaxID=1081104 RepID=A0A168CI21_CORFA|nr:hypothetical protein ISF_01954 [Cordyceps fumosorosea ARSEF 2679]OAA71403.1 hypothetical protein ISF_01954 [Cordyceps fumosorosea ARSEF 2679]